MSYRLIFLCLSLVVGIALGHDTDIDPRINYSFKDRIHSMCVGHYHLSDAELKEICNHMPEHYSEIVALQSNPPTTRPERYIRKLTVLVIFSDTLSKEQKQQFYRRSYNQALAARKNGAEWHGLLGLLIEGTDCITLPELRYLLKTTTYEPLKPLIEKAIDRLENSTSIREGPEQQESNLQPDKTNLPSAKNHTAQNFYHGLFWLILGILLLGLIGFSIKFLKRREN